MMDENSGSGDKQDQFDFWLGNWQVSWEAGKRGTNKIARILDGRVIREEFDGRPGSELKGVSLSSYHVERDLWQQTWVDNTGNYMAFQGGWHEDTMILTRQVPGKRKGVLQRMVWFDIEPNSLEWHWLLSEDGGQSWEIRWHLHYHRAEDVN